MANHPIVQLIMQLGELGPDLCLIPAGDLLAAPLAVGPRFEADHTTPSSRAVPMATGVAALSRVIEVDGILAPATSGRQAARRTDLATGMAPAAISTKVDMCSDLVGDTGIEPVTSSV